MGCGASVPKTSLSIRMYCVKDGEPIDVQVGNVVMARYGSHLNSDQDFDCTDKIQKAIENDQLFFSGNVCDIGPEDDKIGDPEEGTQKWFYMAFTVSSLSLSGTKKIAIFNDGDTCALENVGGIELAYYGSKSKSWEMLDVTKEIAAAVEEKDGIQKFEYSSAGLWQDCPGVVDPELNVAKMYGICYHE